MDERGARFAEAVGYFRQLLAPERPAIYSSLGTMADVDFLPKPPTGRVPLIVTGSSRHYPLLQDSDGADWQLWFRAMGVADDPRADRGVSFEDDFLLVRAAIAGQGLALVRDVYAVDDIAAGRLALALDLPWPTAFAYYAVTLPRAVGREPVRAFVDWLKEGTGREAAGS